jgi:hypothetical protein
VVGHAEVREVPGDRPVPLDLALVRQDGDRRRGERLGVRGDSEQRLRGHRRGIVDPPDAVALRVDDLAILDDREREARDVERLHGRANEGVDVGRRRRLGGRHRHGDQARHENERR